MTEMRRLIDPSRVEQAHTFALEHGVKLSYRHLGQITRQAAVEAGLPFDISAGDAVERLIELHGGVLVGQLMKYQADPEAYIRHLASEEHAEDYRVRFDAYMREKESTGLVHE